MAIEAFPGNTAEGATLASQVDKPRRCFGLGRVVLVGDRGMVSQAAIERDLDRHELGWITTLRTPTIAWLVAAREFASEAVGGELFGGCGEASCDLQET